MSYNSDLEYFMNRIFGSNNFPDIYTPDYIHKDTEHKRLMMAWSVPGANQSNLTVDMNEMSDSDLVEFTFEYKVKIFDDVEEEDHFTFKASSASYDGWDYEVKDGIVYLTLFEKAKAAPKMKRVKYAHSDTLDSVTASQTNGTCSDKWEWGCRS